MMVILIMSKKRNKKAYFKKMQTNSKMSEELKQEGGIQGFFITCDQNKEK
jgi:hypothetical protein